MKSDQTFDPDGIERSIKQIAASGVLGASERRLALLRYLINKELTGEGTSLKAFTIAVDVLGRDANFDPGSDSIVRSEVGRLRDALRLFNAEHARPEDIRIEIPKGTYRPTFLAPSKAKHHRKPIPARAIFIAASSVILALAAFLVLTLPNEQPRADANLSKQLLELPYSPIRVAVPIPQVLGEQENTGWIAVGLYTELMMDLSVYPWLSVVVPVQGLGDIDPEAVDYVLDGVFFSDVDALEARVRLVAYPEQLLIWTDTQAVELKASNLRGAIAELSSKIAYRLASKEGIAAELTRVKNANGAVENLKAYLCYLGLHGYVTAPTDEDHLNLRNCLLEAVEKFPNFGDGWAALAVVYIDEARFQTNARVDADPWADASNAVEKALLHAPLRMTSLNAALIESVEATTQDPREFDRIAALLLKLFPRHPPTLYNVGSRAAEFLGRWDQGIELIDRAIDLHPDPPSLYYLTRAYHTAMTGSDADALNAAAPLNDDNAISQLLLNYLAATRNNLRIQSERYRQLLADHGFLTHQNLVQLVKGRRYVQELETALLTQLERARTRTQTQ